MRGIQARLGLNACPGSSLVARKWNGSQAGEATEKSLTVAPTSSETCLHHDVPDQAVTLNRWNHVWNRQNPGLWQDKGRQKQLKMIKYFWCKTLKVKISTIFFLHCILNLISFIHFLHAKYEQVYQLTFSLWTQCVQGQTNYLEPWCSHARQMPADWEKFS